jgi:hypothetical protein
MVVPQATMEYRLSITPEIHGYILCCLITYQVIRPKVCPNASDPIGLSVTNHNAHLNLPGISSSVTYLWLLP